MVEQSQGVTKSFVQATQNIGGLLVMDVGPRGGGKTTKAVEVVQLYKETEPEVRRVSNVPIEGAYYKPEILKFLATKLIAEGSEKPYEVGEDGTVRIVPRKQKIPKMLVIVDETAISGLEARGSGFTSPLQTYLLALSRKINVDCELVSQLMCLAKGTMIETPSGFVPIEQIKVGGYVIDNTYWGKRVKQIGATSRQIQNKILRIELESGHSVNATPNHRFPVYRLRQERNDVLASELLVGDMLKIDRWRFKMIVHPFYQLLGLIHAEGHWRTTQGMKETNQLSISLDRREVELQQFVKNVVTSIFPDAHFNIREDETNRYAMTLSRKEIVQFFKGRYENFLLSGGESMGQKRAFLSGFFEGDGCVESQTYTITLCQSESNQRKLEVAEGLLKDLGIPYRLYTEWRKVGGAAAEYAKQDGYVVNRLKIGSAHSAIFANTIGFISSAKQSKLESMTDNLYARISSITEINQPTEVYDLSIAKGAPYFMANGIRSHNSMVDKRAPWLSDYYTLCESFVSQYGYFRYRNFDSNYEHTTTQRIYYDFAKEYLFPKFDTTDIPNYDELASAFKIQYQISDDDMQAYYDIRDGKKHTPPATVQNEPIAIFYFTGKYFRVQMGRYPGETLMIRDDDPGIGTADGLPKEKEKKAETQQYSKEEKEDMDSQPRIDLTEAISAKETIMKPPAKRYECLQRDYFAEFKTWRYRMRQIPEMTSQTAAMDEAGMEPIEEDAA